MKKSLIEQEWEKEQIREKQEKERIAKLLKESQSEAETWKRMYNILKKINGKNL